MVDEPESAANATRDQPRRVARSLIVALLVIVLLGVGFLKQLSLMSDPDSLSLSTYLWVLGLGLSAGLGLAFGTGHPLDPVPWPVFSARRPFSALSLGLATGALICAAYSAILQFTHGSPTIITTAWVAGMLLVLAAAGGPDMRRPIRISPDRARAWVIGGWQAVGGPSLILAAIVVAATLLRVTALNTIPGFVHFDEAGIGINARQIVAGQVSTIFSTGYANIPTLAFTWDALFLRVFGDDLVALRLSSAVPGVLSIWLLASLGKELFSSRTGLLAAALLTFSFYHIHYSRVAQPNMLAVATCLLTLYLLVRALRYDSRLAAAGAGLLVSIDLQVYEAARVIVVIVPMVTGYILLISDRQLLRGRLEILGWTLVALAVGMLPVAVWIGQDWSAFNERAREVMVVGGTSDTERVVHLIFGSTDSGYILRTNLWRAVQTFNYLGDTSDIFLSYHPLLDPLSAALLPAALTYAFCRARRAGFAVCLIIFLVVLFSAGMLTIDQPDWNRLILTGPVMALLIAALLDGLWQALDRVPRLLLANRVAVLCLITAIGYGNYTYYFNQYQPRERASADAIPGDVGTFLGSIHHPFFAYSVTLHFYMNWLELRFLAPNAPGCSVPTDADLRRCPTVVTPDRIFFIDSSRLAIVPTLTRMYPGGVLSRFHSYGSAGTIFLYRVGAGA